MLERHNQNIILQMSTLNVGFNIRKDIILVVFELISLDVEEDMQAQCETSLHQICVLWHVSIDV